MDEIRSHVCPVCGMSFKPVWNLRLPDGRVIVRERKTAIYDRPACRLRAFKSRRAFKRAGVSYKRAGVSGL